MPVEKHPPPGVARGAGASSGTAKKRKPSKVEVAKEASRHLRGSIDTTLESDVPAFEHDDLQLLKFHGIYQQDDRDARAARRATGGEKAWSFMVRTRVPGGVLPADAYLGLDRLADEVTTDRSLRITTRQTVQFHGILKSGLRAAIARMNEHLVTTLAACGDVGRNVMAPAPPLGPSWKAVRQLADELSDALLPQTRAYHEIWLEGKKVESGAPAKPRPDEAEALYGDTYLPRKLKVGIALPEDNSVDVHTQDIGLVAVLAADPSRKSETSAALEGAVSERNKASAASESGLLGVNILVGGGLGMTHRKADTFARLGTPLGYVPRQHAAAAVRIVAQIFRDHGNRADRKHARLKYLIDEWGEERFAQEFRSRAAFELQPWADVGPLRHRDIRGVHRQDDGRFFLGLWIENGRLVDRGRRRSKTAVREIVAALRPTVILTPDQNLLLADLDEDQVAKALKILESYGCDELLEASPLRRLSMACPALPTCGLALAESERVASHVLDSLYGELVVLGLEDEPMTVRMTGCPNGCARPYTADLAFVGRKAGHYDLYVGGGLAGDRLADLWAVEVATADIPASLRPLLQSWAAERQGAEGLSDFYQRRLGPTVRPEGIAAGKLTGDKSQPISQLVQLGAGSRPRKEVAGG